MPNPYLKTATVTFKNVSLEVASIDQSNMSQLVAKHYQTFLGQGNIPGPHLGDPNANVYWLLGNPGGYVPGIPNLVLMNNLTFNAGGNILVNQQYSSHPGFCWLMKNWKAIINATGSIPDIFTIDYFPFHSKNLQPFMRNPSLLPSYDYYNTLIDNAINMNKVIVIGRLQSEWMTRVPQLSNYKNLICLKNPRNVALSPGNMSALEWTMLLNAVQNTTTNNITPYNP